MIYTIELITSFLQNQYFGPVAQTGRALPLQGRGPGFKSRWVHLNTFMYFIISAALFLLEIGVKGKFMI